MTRDVKVNVTRIGVILGALVAFVVLVSALRSAADDRYVKHTEFHELKSDVRVIKCAVRPSSAGCP